MNPTFLISQHERSALFRNQRGLGWMLTYAIVLSVFSLLLISNKELSLLDNAQIVYMMCGTITAAGSVIAVILGADSFAGERERGTLVPLLIAPISPGQILNGKALGLFSAWVVMFILALPYLWSVGVGGQNILQAIIYLAIFGTPLVLGFGYFAMALSARTGNVLSSLLISLIVLLLSASPLLIGPGLRNSAVGKIFDLINPFSSVLNTYDAVIIDSEPFSTQFIHLILVISWILITFLIARKVAFRPRFR